MKRLLSLLFLFSGVSFASNGPIYIHEDPKLNLELENIYQDIMSASGSGSSTGDMLQSDYDTDANGICDEADMMDGSGLTDDTVNGTKLDQVTSGFSYTDGSTWSVVGMDVNGQFKEVPAITTFYFEVSREQPAFVYDATKNAFDIRASTNPDYGLMKFDGDTDEGSNCGYLAMPMVQNLNTGVVPRLDEFVISVGSVTDAGSHDYTVSVTTISQGVNPRTSTYSHATSVTFSATSTPVYGERYASSVTTLTSWDTKLTSGIPWYVKVCRDGDDTSNDSSNITSRLKRVTIRLAHLSP